MHHQGLECERVTCFHVEVQQVVLVALGIPVRCFDMAILRSGTEQLSLPTLTGRVGEGLIVLDK